MSVLACLFVCGWVEVLLIEWKHEYTCEADKVYVGMKISFMYKCLNLYI